MITDQINTTDSQTCTYTHDGLGRVASANCGCSLWSQTFSYDPFGNITKTIPNGCTAMSFQVSYDYTNYTNRITSSPFAYNNNNGDMTADNNHSYGWDNENKLTSIDSGLSIGICIVYDALGRAVEEDKGSACATSPTSSTEIVYGPSGTKLALMNGSSLTKAFVSLPGGVQAVYNSSGLQYYRHPDWLGSSRLSTTTSRTKYYDAAYAPFGEPYAGSGTHDLSFTGQNQDTESSNVPGGAGGLYDFLYRKHSPVQGRWLSPDPSGLAAANPSDPQSWNRYAYVGNRPLNSVDSLGLCNPDDPNDPSCYCDPSDATCQPCDPNDPYCGPPVICGGFPCPIIPPSPPGGYPPSLTNGSIDPNKETANLPVGLDTLSLGLDNLLSFLPGLGCGGLVPGGSGFVATGPSGAGAPPCTAIVMPVTVLIGTILNDSGGASGGSNSLLAGRFWTTCRCTNVNSVPVPGSKKSFQCGYDCSCQDGSGGIRIVDLAKKIEPVCGTRLYCPSDIEILQISAKLPLVGRVGVFRVTACSPD